jgi:hypothetical protein
MEIIESVYASEFTKKTLAQFGWKDGDPIPADLGALLATLKETAPPSTRTDVLVDAETLPEEQLAKAKKMLQKAKDFVAARDKKITEDKETENMAPSVADAFKKLKNADPQIIDDRDQPPTETEKEPTTASAAESLPQESAQPVSVPDALPLATFCPRCGWDVRTKFDIVPTDRDKEDFLATLLGGARFRKKYELFGGRVIVTFRSVLAEENKLIYKQLVLDQQNGVVNTEAEWFVQLMDYRLSCALETITDKNGKVISDVPELEMAGSTKDKTTLVGQLELINKNVLAQEATRRLVGSHLRQFQRLTEAIEAMAVEPSFWDGIA